MHIKNNKLIKHTLTIFSESPLHFDVSIPAVTLKKVVSHS